MGGLRGSMLLVSRPLMYLVFQLQQGISRIAFLSSPNCLRIPKCPDLKWTVCYGVEDALVACHAWCIAYVVCRSTYIDRCTYIYDDFAVCISISSSVQSFQVFLAKDLLGSQMQLVGQSISKVAYLEISTSPDLAHHDAALLAVMAWMRGLRDEGFEAILSSELCLWMYFFSIPIVASGSSERCKIADKLVRPE